MARASSIQVAANSNRASARMSTLSDFRFQRIRPCRRPNEGRADSQYGRSYKDAHLSSHLMIDIVIDYISS